MELTYQAPEIYPSSIIFKLNHRLFLNTLEGVTEEQAKERISGHSNPFIWIATHTVWARYNTLGLLGSPVENPFKGLFENFKAYDTNDNYPTLAEVKTAWEKAGGLLKEALHSVTPAQLAMDAPFKNPIGDFTIGGTIIFFAQHESYDIGQMGYLKKYFTKEAMKY